MWKAWENDKTVFPPFPHTLEIAKGGDSHIPPATTTTEINISRTSQLWDTHSEGKVTGSLKRTVVTDGATCTSMELHN
jgi:hypothetical protein